MINKDIKSNAFKRKGINWIKHYYYIGISFMPVVCLLVWEIYMHLNYFAIYTQNQSAVFEKPIKSLNSPHIFHTWEQKRRICQLANFLCIYLISSQRSNSLVIQTQHWEMDISKHSWSKTWLHFCQQIFLTSNTDDTDSKIINQHWKKKMK